MPELRPGVFTGMFAALAFQADERLRVGLTSVAGGIERQAKTNVQSGQHRYGTPTPAHPGSGPARISGTLLRAIDHSPPTRTATGWECRVGVIAGMYPTYGARRSTTSAAEYGQYLERGLRNGATYPWLGPAFRHGHRVIAPVVFHSVFSGPWL